MTPKPAYDALMKLIHHDWWTSETLTTDAQGNCSVRAFCGDYDVTPIDATHHMIHQQIQLPLAEINAPESPVHVEIKL